MNNEAPVNIKKGNVIKENFNSELDELRSLSISGKDYLNKILEREKNNTGITSLKISFNNVFGYFIEVRNIHKDKVPEEWIRLIAEMVKHWREDGFDVVFSTRTKRHGEPLIKKIISSIGYKILKKFTNIPIEKDSGDFRLISRKVITEYKKFSEVYPFFRFVVD